MNSIEELVIGVLKQPGQHYLAEVAEKIGYSPAKVSPIVQDMKRKGIIEEEPQITRKYISLIKGVDNNEKRGIGTISG